MLFARENAVKLRYLSKKYIGKSMSFLERRVSENYIIKSISFRKRKTLSLPFFHPPLHTSGKRLFFYIEFYMVHVSLPLVLN